MKSATYVVGFAFVAVFCMVTATIRFVFFTPEQAVTSIAVGNQTTTHIAADDPATTKITAERIGNETIICQPSNVSQSLAIRSGKGSAGKTSRSAVAVRRIPLEETPLAIPEVGSQDVTAKAFNQAAAVLKKALTKFDKSSIFTSYNGVYALAVSGKAFILASSDGTVVVFQQSADGQLFETSSGTSCPFIAQKDNYYLAKLAVGAYVLTLPSGEEYTLGGAQNAEDDQKPFSSNPSASDTIATLASLQSVLPRDHELYTTPDKLFAVVTAGDGYVIIKSDGSMSRLSLIGSSEYSLKTDAGTTCPVVAGDSSVAIGKLAPQVLVLKNADGTETVLPKAADASDYEAIAPSCRDLNATPPDLISDPLYTPGQLVYTGLIRRNEWELSLSEQRVRRRQLAEISSNDPSASSL